MPVAATKKEDKAGAKLEVGGGRVETTMKMEAPRQTHANSNATTRTNDLHARRDHWCPRTRRRALLRLVQNRNDAGERRHRARTPPTRRVAIFGAVLVLIWPSSSQPQPLLPHPLSLSSSSQAGAPLLVFAHAVHVSKHALSIPSSFSSPPVAFGPPRRLLTTRRR